ncbi:hypothetical protein DEO72_LG1g2937 [Vigna unguiculata]|uniref:Uncharacterized protein n=1 Tax=Vigna unguiculata TaxID=3917 RepID=A0A4D6KNQ4_VIGUN|nr:hypothetical protein DEO72_LG1g2937 [Vigna unguiculata]
MKLGGEGKIRAESGKQKLGLWFDDRRRSREIVVPFVGEGEVGKKKVRQWKTTKENLWQSWKDGGNNDKEVHSEQPDGGDKVVDPELQDDVNNETCKDGMEDDGNNPDEVGYDKVDGGDKDRMDDDVQGDMEGRHDEGVDDVEVHSWVLN